MSARWRWIAWAAVCVLGACTDRVRDDELVAALANIAPHASRFATFESWARRAYSVADPKASERSLGETLFAPLRNDRELLAAWIQVGVRSPRVLAIPSTSVLPDTHEWTAVRDPSLGWIRVGRFDPCPIETPHGWRKELQPVCVIISRDPRGDDGSEPRITMAFMVRAGTDVPTTEAVRAR